MFRKLSPLPATVVPDPWATSAADHDQSLGGCSSSRCTRCSDHCVRHGDRPKRTSFQLSHLGGN